VPTLALLAGQNGAGKTTFINGFLRERAEKSRFINREAVARSHARPRFSGDLPVACGLPRPHSAPEVD